MGIHTLGELKPCIELRKWIVQQIGTTQAFFLKFRT